MISEILAEKLNYTKAYRKTRLEVAHWVIEHPESYEALLKHCLEVTTEISYKAAWILEFVCAEKLKFLLPHLDYFFAHLPNIKRDQALRPLAKICEMLAVAYYKNESTEVRNKLTLAHKMAMTECGFDWLITDQKVACQAYSMTTLYFLGTEIDWIHHELKIIIEQNIHQGSPAYKARGKNVLEKIVKAQARKNL